MWGKAILIDSSAGIESSSLPNHIYVECATCPEKQNLDECKAGFQELPSTERMLFRLFLNFSSFAKNPPHLVHLHSDLLRANLPEQILFVQLSNNGTTNEQCFSRGWVEPNENCKLHLNIGLHLCDIENHSVPTSIVLSS